MIQTCVQCSVTKAVTDFAVNQGANTGYHSWCKSCMSEYSKAHYRRHKEERLKQTGAYQKAHPELSRVCTQRWKDSHPEVYRESQRRTDRQRSGVKRLWSAQYRDLCNQWARDWRRRNPEKVIASDNFRKARLRSSPGRFTAEEFKALKEKYNNRCLACSLEKPLTADHIVPVVKGGWNSIDNIQPLCRSCNSRKNCKTIDYRPMAKVAA